MIHSPRPLPPPSIVILWFPRTAPVLAFQRGGYR